MQIQHILLFIFEVLSGTGVFLIGVTLLTNNIEQLATSKIKNLFNKTADKKILNVGIGAATTAFIQSSGVTTVLIIGFVNVGLINLSQATAMIMGANIGTTITAQIASLSALPITKYIEVLSFLGIIISMICSSDKIKKIGFIICGFGLIFIGLSVMSNSMQANSDAVKDIFTSIQNPFILLLIGILLTAIVQSSSAITSIIIAMSIAGLTIGSGGNEILFIILGTNIGSCVTALLSSIGGNSNAKRTSLIHLLFNVFGAVLYFIILIIFPNFMNVTFRTWFKDQPATQIAMFHTFFNVSAALIFLPFSNIFVKITEFIIKDKDKNKTVTYLDERILSSSALAINQLEKEMLILADTAMDSFRLSYQSFVSKDTSKYPIIQEKIDNANAISQNIINYLIKTSSKCSVNEEVLISNIHNNIGDVMRIAEIADNFTKYTKREISDNIEFSEQVKIEISLMVSKIEELFNLTKEVILNKNKTLLTNVDLIEEEIDAFRKSLIDGHIDRLNKGTCKPESSGIFINLVSNLERLGDHLTYIAHTIE